MAFAPRSSSTDRRRARGRSERRAKSQRWARSTGRTGTGGEQLRVQARREEPPPASLTRRARPGRGDTRLLSAPDQSAARRIRRRRSSITSGRSAGSARAAVTRVAKGPQPRLGSPMRLPAPRRAGMRTSSASTASIAAVQIRDPRRFTVDEQPKIDEGLVIRRARANRPPGDRGADALQVAVRFGARAGDSPSENVRRTRRPPRPASRNGRRGKIRRALGGAEQRRRVEPSSIACGDGERPGHQPVRLAVAKNDAGVAGRALRLEAGARNGEHDLPASRAGVRERRQAPRASRVGVRDEVEVLDVAERRRAATVAAASRRTRAPDVAHELGQRRRPGRRVRRGR